MTTSNQQPATSILVFDTSISSENLGDLIICDSVYKILYDLFEGFHFTNTTTHDRIGRATWRLNEKSFLSFVAGTNLLTSRTYRQKQWRLRLRDALHLKNLLLLGAGWTDYQDDPTNYTKWFYRKILSHNLPHAVRDGYTKKKIESVGLNNVLNTGCPTTWNLTPDFCNKITREKSKNVVFTLTDYRQDPQSDSFFIKTLFKKYKDIYFWPQGTGDLKYLQSLGFSNIFILPSNLPAYDNLLKSDLSLDYIGTRLHAGIRALQHQRRSIIFSIDNRAAEMGADINLPVLERSSINNSLQSKIDISWKTDIVIREQEIQEWRNSIQAHYKENFKII